MPEQGSNRQHTRRRFLTATGAAATAMVAGCLGGGSDAIQFILNPAEDTVDIEAQYQPLFTSIEDEFDVEIEGKETTSYAATTEEIQAAGDGDRVYADTSPGAVPQLGEEADVVGLRVAFGAERYFGLLVTRPDTGIESLSDIGQDTRVTTQTVASVSGGMAPFFMLQEAGLDIGDAPDGGSAGDFDWVQADAHDTAVSQLVNGDVDVAAGGAFVTVAHVPPEQIRNTEPHGPTLADISPDFEDAGTRDPELRVLDISPPIPRAPILANSEWQDDTREQIDQFMLGAEPEQFEHDAFDLADQLGSDLPDGLLEDYNNGEVAESPVEAYDLSSSQEEDWLEFQDNELWFSGVTDGTREDYEPVNDFADAIGVDLGDV